MEIRFTWLEREEWAWAREQGWEPAEEVSETGLGSGQAESVRASERAERMQRGTSTADQSSTGSLSSEERNGSIALF